MLTGRASCVALLLVVVPLLPACQLFLPVGTVLGERLLYTPSIGFCLLLGWACDSAPSPRSAVGWRLAVAGLLGCGYAALTVQRNGVWYDDATLFRDAALACPDSAKVQATLGTTAVKAGQVGEAESHFSRAIEIFPEYDDGLYSLGRLYFDEAQARPNMRLTLAEKAEKLLMSASASHRRRPAALAVLTRHFRPASLSRPLAIAVTDRIEEPYRELERSTSRSSGISRLLLWRAGGRWR